MRARLQRSVAAISRFWLAPPQPLVGIELREDSVGVVRASRDKGRVTLAGAATVGLPEGALVPHVAETNLVDQHAVARALRVAAERAGAAAGGPAALVLPDQAVRVATFEMEQGAAGKKAELLDLARFRLRRLVPYDTRDARIAAVRPRAEGLPAVAAICAKGIAAEYEAMVESCGFWPGVVEPSGLALTALLPADGTDRLLVGFAARHITLVVARGDWPLLLRAVSGVASSLDELMLEVRNTLLFCREKMAGVAPAQIVLHDPEQFGVEPAGLSQLGIEVRTTQLPWLEGSPLAADAGRGIGAALAVVLGRVQ